MILPSNPPHLPEVSLIDYNHDDEESSQEYLADLDVLPASGRVMAFT